VRRSGHYLRRSAEAGRFPRLYLLDFFPPLEVERRSLQILSFHLGSDEMDIF
jgi:hypothetical protein